MSPAKTGAAATEPVSVESNGTGARPPQSAGEAEVAAPMTPYETPDPNPIPAPPAETPIPGGSLRPDQNRDLGNHHRGTPDLPSRPVGNAVSTTQAAQQNMQDAGEGPYGRPASSRGLLPKPITTILPYYDYSPDGQDPCEFLCPRPDGCPPDAESKPCPESVELPEVSLDGRVFHATHVMWEPSNLFHNPLYFEDPSLERYGHTHCALLQPFVSVGRFGAQLIGLPYQVALHPVHEREYTLGWHRPGECVPYRYHVPPWNTKAAITAGAAYTGLIFLIP